MADDQLQQLVLTELRELRSEIKDLTNVVVESKVRLNNLKCNEHSSVLRDVARGKYAKQEDLTELEKVVSAKIHWSAFWVALIPSLASVAVAILIKGDVLWR